MCQLYEELPDLNKDPYSGMSPLAKLQFDKYIQKMEHLSNAGSEPEQGNKSKNFKSRYKALKLRKFANQTVTKQQQWGTGISGLYLEMLVDAALFLDKTPPEGMEL